LPGGARPSDGRDDTAAFASALRAAADAGNGVVRVGAGTYEVVPDQLTVGTGATLTGRRPNGGRAGAERARAVSG
jgi:hypothetical protein